MKYNLEDCNHCSRCLGVCPMYAEFRDEYFSARGFIQLLINNYELDTSQKEDIFSFCKNCFNCSEICQNDVRIAEYLQQLS